MKNGEQFKECVLTLQINLTKEYIFKRNKEELGKGNIMCSRNS